MFLFCWKQGLVESGFLSLSSLILFESRTYRVWSCVGVCVARPSELQDSDDTTFMVCRWQSRVTKFILFHKGLEK